MANKIKGRISKRELVSFFAKGVIEIEILMDEV